MDNAEVDAGQGFEKSYFLIHIEICSLSRVNFVWSDLDDNDDVSSLDIRHLITLSMDGKLFLLWRSLAHFDLDLLLVSLDFLSLADLASFFHVDHFSLTIAIIARSSALRVHAWAHLSHGGSHSTTFASSARLNS
jgi:hypothetical protein